MSEPNEVIKIYKGSYKLVKGAESLTINGEIFFTWFPRIGAKFAGDIVGVDTDKVSDFLELNDVFNVEVDGASMGAGTLLNYTIGIEAKLYGRIADPAVVGDRSYKVDKVKFIVPNLMEFRGENVLYNTASGSAYGFNRLVFTDTEHIITLDKSQDFKERLQQLEQKGGYVGLYSGEFVRVDGKKMSFEQVSQLSFKFSTFLSFLNGKKTSAMFWSGYVKDKLIWQDYTRKSVEQHFHIIHWPYTTKTENFDSLWKNFSSLWQDKDNQYFLETAINWYTEANTNKIFVESMIMLAQTNLELLYNWLVVEKNEMLDGKDASGITAANKIRLLLTCIQVPKQIPKDFKSLMTAEKAKDGPEVITIIRNAIVHSQEEKRKKLKAMDPDVKYEALQVSLWYIELSLLFILGYQGIYLNRCKRVIFITQAGQYVPWVKKEKNSV